MADEHKTDEQRGFEAWFEQRYPEERERAMHSWELAAVRQHRKWGAGKEMTRADFEAALSEVNGLRLGGTPELEEQTTSEQAEQK